jgi:hypothetical protein
MLDAYDHEYIPEHLLTQEFLREVRSLLRPGGVLAANTFSSSRLYNNESVTYRSVFGEFYNLKGNNRVILARNGALPAVSVLQQQIGALDAGFRRLGFSMQDIMPRFSMSVDWDTGARILTDSIRLRIYERALVGAQRANLGSSSCRWRTDAQQQLLARQRLEPRIGEFMEHIGLMAMGSRPGCRQDMIDYLDQSIVEVTVRISQVW